jgi:hypothetical protein
MDNRGLPPQTSNSDCLPGRAGGTPRGLVTLPCLITDQLVVAIWTEPNSHRGPHTTPCNPRRARAASRPNVSNPGICPGRRATDRSTASNPIAPT